MGPETRRSAVAATLWRVSLVRGLAAVTLGGYLLLSPPASWGAFARAVALYWAVEGLIVLWGSLTSPMLSLNRVLVFLRSVAGIVASLVIVAFPLEAAFGRWQPGQLVLLVVVLPLALLAIVLQILAAVFDIVMSMAVRRHIPGEWSLALSAIISIAFGAALVAVILAPPAVLGRGVGGVAIAGGLAVMVGAVRLRPAAHSSLRAIPR